jgi:transposase
MVLAGTRCSGKLLKASSPGRGCASLRLSEPEFTAFISQHLSTPRRGPKCKLGYHCVFNLILWVLYTGMQWKCLPVPRTADGKAEIHYTTIYRVFTRWSDDGSLGQAFIASVRRLAAHGHLDLNVLHGDGTNTVAKKGGDGIGSRVRGLREIWVSGGEAEGLHFVGVLSFGDEFREDGALEGIQ